MIPSKVVTERLTMMMSKMEDGKSYKCSKTMHNSELVTKEDCRNWINYFKTTDLHMKELATGLNAIYNEVINKRGV